MPSSAVCGCCWFRIYGLGLRVYASSCRVDATACLTRCVPATTRAGRTLTRARAGAPACYVCVCASVCTCVCPCLCQDCVPALGLRVRLSRASLRERPYVIDRGPGTITAVQKGGRCGEKKKHVERTVLKLFALHLPPEGNGNSSPPIRSADETYYGRKRDLRTHSEMGTVPSVSVRDTHTHTHTHTQELHGSVRKNHRRTPLQHR
jgi:hypothetical protein